MRGHIFFNRIDQIGNTDRLGEKWMPPGCEGQSLSPLSSQGRQKGNRCSMQRRIGLNPCNDFATIRFRHLNISRQKVYETILEAVRERVEMHKHETDPKRRSPRLSPPP